MERFLKICLFPIFFFLFLNVTAQTYTVQPDEVVVEQGIYSNVDAWFSAPAGTQVNYRFAYFGENSDTSYTDNQSYVSLGVSHNLQVNDLVVDCDSLWTGYFQAWPNNGDTLQSNNLSWTVPCASEVAVQYSIQEIIDTGVVITLDYNSGGVPAGLYWYTSVNDVDPVLNSQDVFGVGTHMDTLFIDVGTSWEVCNVEINNNFDIAFLAECQSGVMPALEVVSPDVNLVASHENNELHSELYIANSGNVQSSFEVLVERVLCDGGLEVYGDPFLFEFDELIMDSLITLPVLSELPQTSEWKFTLTGTNGEFELEPLEVFVDVAVGLEPIVAIELDEISDGFYEVIVTWDDFGAGNVALELFDDDANLIASAQPDTSPWVFELPYQISAYTEEMVAVELTSNACAEDDDFTITTACTTPQLLLNPATNITQTSALVELSSVMFNGCVNSDQAMVGIVLVGQDTIWVEQEVNTQMSTNYLIPLEGLQPLTTYVYQGIACGEGQCFTTLPLSFTTLTNIPVPPTLGVFAVYEYEDFLVQIQIEYELNEYDEVGLRVIHGVEGSESEIYSNDNQGATFPLFEYNLGGYGTHTIRCELYNPSDPDDVFEVSDTWISTYVEPVSVQELGYSVTRFDRVIVIDKMGRTLYNVGHDQDLPAHADLPVGMYIFTGVTKEGTAVSSKILLGQ